MDVKRKEKLEHGYDFPFFGGIHRSLYCMEEGCSADRTKCVLFQTDAGYEHQ